MAAGAVPAAGGATACHDTGGHFRRCYGRGREHRYRKIVAVVVVGDPRSSGSSAGSGDRSGSGS